jgi:hypothetical protein
MPAIRVNDRSALIALPHRVCITVPLGENVVTRIHAYKTWVEDENVGTSGEYGISYLSQDHEVIVSFSDPASAIYFKFRWYNESEAPSHVGL